MAKYPSTLSEYKLEHIIEWCKENDQVDWLKTEANKTVKTKSGKEIAMPFLTLRNNWARKFAPELAPKSKKKKTMLEMINEL